MADPLGWDVSGDFVIAVTFLIEMVVAQPHPVKIAFISFR
ncbi:hypothetical protein EBESD8_6130 [Rhodococcus aetherivorans]|jgi:hypothetical protein|nr:hypothetical protein EBESD8_6130 [Rhodococcus aetherivorans]